MRIREHKYALTSEAPESLALAEHSLDTGHAIDWVGARVLDAHPNVRQTDAPWSLGISCDSHMP